MCEGLSVHIRTMFCLSVTSHCIRSAAGKYFMEKIIFMEKYSLVSVIRKPPEALPWLLLAQRRKMIVHKNTYHAHKCYPDAEWTADMPSCQMCQCIPVSVSAIFAHGRTYCSVCNRCESDLLSNAINRQLY